MAALDADALYCKSIQNCQCVKRINEALIKYSSLNLIDKNDLEELIKFSKKDEQQIINDFIHIVTEHNSNHDISHIYNHIVQNEYHIQECDLSNCAVSVRYGRNRSNINTKYMDYGEEYMLWIDLFDSIHCYIYHLYDFGYRINDDDLIENVVDDYKDNEEKYSCYDKKFNSVYSIIADKQKALGKMNQFGGSHTNKFNINIDAQSHDDIEAQQEEIRTFTDALFFYTSKDMMYNASLSRLNTYFTNEHYDTDSLRMDINDGKSNSNIYHSVQNGNLYEYIRRYIKQTNLTEKAFNTGFIFYYWDWYKHRTQHEHHSTDNINDHSGYSPSDLFIQKKYNSLKEEILNNTILCLELHQFNLSLKKANVYMFTQFAKNIKADYGVEYELHYGISDQSAISMNHLLAVSLYCDWSDLCFKFSSTFRSRNSFEPLELIKNRNREFWNWSKLLREAVQYFGTNGYDGASGPYYCGMSVVMPIPEFNIRLCGPTSTSTQIAVASRFSGDNGMVIKLNNNGDIDSELLRAFSCSWISQYPGENEHLFIGGQYRLRLESIIHIDTTRDFKHFVHALFWFDCMVNGTRVYKDDIDITRKDEVILSSLIKGNSNCHKYIQETFELFCFKKQQVVLNLHHLTGWHFRSLSQLILLEKEGEIMFKETIFKLFKNMENFIVYAGNYRDGNKYSFSLQSLLSLLCSTSFISSNVIIQVKASQQYQYDENYNKKWIERSWIYTAYNHSTKSKFNAAKWNISLEETNHYGRDKQDCLTMLLI